MEHESQQGQILKERVALLHTFPRGFTLSFFLHLPSDRPYRDETTQAIFLDFLSMLPAWALPFWPILKASSFKAPLSYDSNLLKAEKPKR